MPPPLESATARDGRVGRGRRIAPVPRPRGPAAAARRGIGSSWSLVLRLAERVGLFTDGAKVVHPEHHVLGLDAGHEEAANAVAGANVVALAAADVAERRDAVGRRPFVIQMPTRRRSGSSGPRALEADHGAERIARRDVVAERFAQQRVIASETRPCRGRSARPSRPAWRPQPAARRVAASAAAAAGRHSSSRRSRWRVLAPTTTGHRDSSEQEGAYGASGASVVGAVDLGLHVGPDGEARLDHRRGVAERLGLGDVRGAQASRRSTP